MKYLTYTLLAVALLATACSTKKSESEEKKETTCTYGLDLNSVSFGWTAYKFNTKAPVKGTFNDIQVQADSAAASLAELLQSVHVSIATNSVNSNDPVRDAKISQFFFGTMAATDVIKAAFVKADSSSATASLTMNELTVDIPGTLTLSGDTLTFQATIDLNAFNGADAVAKLNEVCQEKHTGQDGVSKLWDVVDVSAKAVVKTNCQ